MKIESTGVHATPRQSETKVSAERKNGPRNTKIVSSNTAPLKARIVDTVELSTVRSGAAENQRVDSGDYSAKIQRVADEKKLYPMSELNKKTEERLQQFGNDNDTVESLAELKLNDDRKDMVEVAKLRMQSGFYDRPEVVDEIARRIIEGI